MALFGAFLGIFSNVVRVNAIVLIDWIRGSQMELTAHRTIQWIALFATLGLLFYVLSRLNGDAEPAAPVVDAPEHTGPVRRFAPVFAGLSMLLIGGSAAALPTNELRPPRVVHAGLFPQNISGSELVKPAVAWSVDEASDVESTDLTYRHDGRDIQVVIVAPLSSNAKLPESTFAPHDNDIWRQKQIQREVACAASNCIKLLHSTWQRDKGDQLRHVYYAYSLGSFSTESKLAFRAVHGWYRLIGARDHRRLIRFISDDAALDVDQLGAAFEMLRSAVRESERK